ncbi:MAG: succinylglutamate desuccinylase/aspartoacylase family protein [Geminicoccaceae bacterium]|nr:succinylglutamate desuccinylase/aspartoacylase family protein [Geminicoccaceae bacterium]
MSDAASRISPTIDLDAPGKRQGHLHVPWSRDRSAWGAVRPPITVLRGGQGPHLLLLAGNHGDEYEGIIALLKLAETLGAENLAGAVTILPSLNHPAVLAGSRASPIDQGNMNRVFPGRRVGTVTEMIADFVLRELVARADVVVDLHAGGKSLDFVPSVVLHDLPVPDHMQRTMEAARAFGAPLTLLLDELDMEGMLDLHVERLGKLFLSTELGGGGGTTPERVAIAERGLQNLLVHFGLVPGRLDLPRPSRLMAAPNAGFVVSDTAGILEPLVPLGAEVRSGTPLARIHAIEDTGVPARTFTAPMDGLLYARHHPGLIGRGDCLAVLGRDATRPGHDPDG